MRFIVILISMSLFIVVLAVKAFLAAQHIDDIVGLAVQTHIDVYFEVVWVDLTLPRGDKLAYMAVVAFFIPGMFLFGLAGGGPGTFAPMSLYLILGGLLYATKGCEGKTSAKCWS